MREGGQIVLAMKEGGQTEPGNGWLQGRESWSAQVGSFWLKGEVEASR